MATKKRKKSVGGRRRKKMGAIKNDGSIEAIAGGIAGFILSRFIGNSIPTTVSAETVGIVEVAAGAALAYFPKNWFVKGVGIGIAANGANDTLESFGLLTGVGNAYDPSRALNGYRDVNRLGDAPFPKPAGVGNADKMARMYAGVYNN